MEFDHSSDESQIDNQRNKPQAEQDYTSYLRNTDLDKNSYMFLNDKNHLFNKQPPKVKTKKYEKQLKEVKVEMKNIYNYVDENKFINEEQQSDLNNDYDFQFTKMLQILLKQEDNWENCFSHSNKEVKPELINQYFETCENVISKFHQLMDNVYPKPLNDFKFRDKLQSDFKLADEDNIKNQAEQQWKDLAPKI